MEECKIGVLCNNDTPRIYGVCSRSLTDKKGFNIQVLADSGCTMSLMPSWISSKNNIKVNKEAAEGYSLKNASGKKMVVDGTETVFITPTGCRTKRKVMCLVSLDLKDSDFLLSWVEMKRPL